MCGKTQRTSDQFNILPKHIGQSPSQEILQTIDYVII